MQNVTFFQSQDENTAFSPLGKDKKGGGRQETDKDKDKDKKIYREEREDITTTAISILNFKKLYSQIFCLFAFLFFLL